MSRMRVIAPSASLVWTVDSTRWPVSDAWTAMSAVSRSRISPTITTSGSWRRIARRPAGEGHSDLGIDLRLADSVDRIFDRILDGQDVAAAVVEMLQRGVERGRLARSGRPGDEDDAVGLGQRLAQDVVGRRRRGRAPRGSSPAASLSRIRSTTRSPARLGSVETRTSSILPPSVRPIRPSCGTRRSAMSSRAMTLIRLTTTGATCAGMRRRFAKHAVDPHADDQAALIGLDMDVADPAADGFGEDAVDQPDRRRIVGAVEQVLGGRDAARQRVEVVVAVDRFRRARRRSGRARSGPADSRRTSTALDSRAARTAGRDGGGPRSAPPDRPPRAGRSSTPPSSRGTTTTPLARAKA